MIDPPMVFVVDDDDFVRHSFELLLAALKIPVRTFASADVFLDALPTAATGCVFVDLQMKGLNGLELIRYLRQKGSPLSTVLMTGHGDEVMLGLATEAGAVATLEKPFCVSRLKELLRTQLPVP